VNSICYLSGGLHHGLVIELPDEWTEVVLPELNPPSTWIRDNGTNGDVAQYCIRHTYRRHPVFWCCFVLAEPSGETV
jgi:hypothetical protein